MAATLHEHVKSRRFTVSEKSPKVTLVYTASEAPDYADVEEAIYTQTPATFEGLSRLDFSADPIGGDLQTVEVQYGVPTSENPALTETPLSDQTQLLPPLPFDGQGDAGEPPTTDPGDLPSANATDNDRLGPEWSFTTTGGTVHVNQSIATIVSKGIVGHDPPPNFHRAIGVNGDGDVEGVDIVQRRMEFTYTAQFKFITQKYIKDLMELTGKVNNADFFIYIAREVLFLGAEGSFKSGEGWTITFRFVYSPNSDGEDISDELAIGAGKGGHDYLWVHYKTRVEGSQKMEKPVAAYVEQVYKQGDFSVLGI